MSESEQTVAVPEPAPEPVYLFTLDGLISEHDRLVQKEAADRALLDTIEFPDTEALRAKLTTWAKAGFPDAFPIFDIELSPPFVCSDGIARNLFDYASYLMGISIADKMDRLSAKLQGMRVLCSYSDNVITFRMFKV